VKFPSVPLGADEQLTIAGSGTPAVAHVDGEELTEEILGHLTFESGDTVRDAVAQFNGYNGMKIVVDDATAAKPMRGAFEAIDPLSFAAAVERITGSTAVQESAELLRIGPEEPHRR
jgi:ferric-dicitrate binding protein FerR (iron transport regulator)